MITNFAPGRARLGLGLAGPFFMIRVTVDHTVIRFRRLFEYVYCDFQMSLPAGR